MIENFKVIPDCPNYSVSDRGTVINNITDRILSPQKMASGYYIVRLSTAPGIFSTKIIHRLVMDAFGDPQPSPEYTDIKHINGDRQDNRVENLKWQTRSDSTSVNLTNKQRVKQKLMRSYGYYIDKLIEEKYQRLDELDREDTVMDLLINDEIDRVIPIEYRPKYNKKFYHAEFR